MARKSKTPPCDTIWEIPDDLWHAAELILDQQYPQKPTGRPRANLRQVLDAIVFRMRSGCQWNRLPERYGSDSTAHRWFQRFCQDGIFESLWGLLVETCDDLAQSGNCVPKCNWQENKRLRQFQAVRPGN